MITVNLIKDSNENISGFSLEGHSGYADAGMDIVCAAVSTLAINTVNSIEKLTSDADNIVLGEDTEPGNLKVVFKRPVSKETRLLIDSMFLGLSDIQKNYGDQFVKVFY